jgi:hypothetical protein
MSEQREFGLLVRPVVRHGTRYIEASLCTRNPGEVSGDIAPYGAGDDTCLYERPKHLVDTALDGLGLYGFVSEYKHDGESLCSFIGDSVEFRDVYAIDHRRATNMAKTLKRVNAQIDKNKAYEPGDKFAALAQALKLDFAVEDRKDDLPRSGIRWRYMTVAEGRNRYREIIEQERKTETERRFPRAVA